MGVAQFFLQKIWRPLLVIASERDELFSCRLVITPIYPRLYSVLSKFSHKKINFRSGVTP